MPPNTATLRVGPYFLSLLLVLVALFGLVFLPGQRHTPKLGLDLEGGATVTLQAQSTNGKKPSQQAMKVARQILENRVNGSGVSAAQVFQQGTDQIVISVPGANLQSIARIGQAAKLNYRPLILAAVANTSTAATTATGSASGASATATPTSGATGTGTSTGTGTGTASSTSAPKATTSAATTAPKATTSPNGLLDAKDAPTTAKSTAAKTTTAATTAAATTPTPTATATTAKLSVDPFTNLGFTLPKTEAAFATLTPAQQTALTTALGNFDCAKKPTDVATEPLAACDVTTAGTPPAFKYLLGPVIVAGTEISSADAVAPSASGTSVTSSWTVSINLKNKGQTAWTNWTAAHHDANTAGTDTASACSATTVPCADYVAFTLDGAVIAAPVTEGTINGTTQVSGAFTESFAKTLADDLKYGALPVNFDQLTAQDISATLGNSQLAAGLLAGGIGLLLVVVYSFLYYRGLGFVTVFSLLVSGGLTYGSLVILGREIGFTLTLAGIAGFIVAVGITADSFVVLFERLKDEVHSGRSLRVAVPRAWTRARRTILSADTVSFLAAAVLYYFTVGDVRGFAFTLGLSTLLDIVVVFLFTHPLVSLLSRSSAFGSPRFTGLNSVREGGIAPSPEGHVRATRSRPARGSAAAPAGGVALLEREQDSDVDDDFDQDGYDAVLDADGAAAAPVATAPATPDSVADSGAPRRSRVVPRSAPAAEISADAAERAAARRGRQVRPPKAVIEAPVDEEIDEDESVEDGISEDSAVSDTDADVATADLSEAEVEAPSDEPAPPGPVPPVVPEDKPETPPRAQASAPSTAPTTPAERAAARRRGRVAPARPAIVVPPAVDSEPEVVLKAEPEPELPEPALPEPARPEPARPEPAPAQPATAQVADPAPEPEPEPEPMAEPERRSTTAADRAAARRARIRARADGTNESGDTDADSEDES